jgi:hypothetical protein
MPLTRRQQILYTDRVDVYRPSEIATEAGGKAAKDPIYQLAYSSVPCKFWTSIQSTAPDPQGRGLQDNMFTLDSVSFDAAQTILDGYLVTLTSNHPNRGFWYVAQGNEETWVDSSKRRKPNYIKVKFKRVPKPRIESDVN